MPPTPGYTTAYELECLEAVNSLSRQSGFGARYLFSIILLGFLWRRHGPLSHMQMVTCSKLTQFCPRLKFYPTSLRKLKYPTTRQ